jgi:glycosyltransferase involved in cell wall biosynthesis
VAFGVAPRERIEVVPLGFDLSGFTEHDGERDEIRRATRERLGIAQNAPLVSIVARVVKVKRIDRFLEMARQLPEDTWFLVAGDGDRRDELERSSAARAMGERLVWAGFERDVAAICFASDVVVLSSDNEGTPVSLIEAGAAAVPVVATRAGGVETVVLDGETGIVVEPDARALATATAQLLRDRQMRERMGQRGRAHALATFGIDRLVADIDRLYTRLLAESEAHEESARWAS